MGFSPGPPALKRAIKRPHFTGALKRSFPRINAGAPAEKYKRNSEAAPKCTAEAPRYPYSPDYTKSETALAVRGG